jgi:hypothetical protein
MAPAARLGPLEKLESLRRWAEKATGTRPSAAQSIQALADLVVGRISVTPAMVEHLTREATQQELINGCVRWSMRTQGPQSSYGEAYKVYLDHAHQRGLKILSLKTFKNRALDAYGEDVSLATNIVPLRPYAIVRPLFAESAFTERATA